MAAAERIGASRNDGEFSSVISTLMRRSECLLSTIVVGSAASCIVFLVLTYLDLYRLPILDGVTWYAQIIDAGDRLVTYWQQWGEHRLVLAKLLILADIELFRGSPYFIHLVTLACLVGAFVLLVAPFRAEVARGVLGANASWLIVALMSLLFFRSFTLSLYVTVLNIQHAPALLFFLLALRSINAPSPDRRVVALSIGWAMLSTLSSAGGLLSWPILSAVALRRRLPVVVQVALLADGLVVLAVYFHDFAPTGHNTDPRVVLAHPFEVGRFLAYFFGSPLVRSARFEWLGVTIGFVSLALIAVLLLMGCFRVLDRESRFYHAVLVFAGGSAVLCSVRFEEGYGVAASDRYSLYVVLAHVAMLGMVRHRVVALYDNHRPVAAGACLIAIALIFAEHAVSGTAYRQRALAIGGVAQAIRSPDFPLAIMEEISPLHPDGGKRLVDRLRARELYPFPSG